jgi:hypothetical protein
MSTPPHEEPGQVPGERKGRQMATKSSDDTDAVNERLLHLLEQLVANQAVQATANLHEEVAQRLTAAATYRDGQDRQRAVLSDSQQQLVLRFRALRNGLGNLARHGGRDTVLMPAPQLCDGTLYFVAALPPEAETLRLFGRDGKETGRFDHVGGATTVQGAGVVGWIQVDDQHGNPILLGFPLEVCGEDPIEERA